MDTSSQAIKLYSVERSDNLSHDEFDGLFSLATAGRKARSKKFLRREDACRSLVAEALIRHGLREYAGIALGEDTVSYNEFGKPGLSGSPVSFNISHSGQWVICGIDQSEIGVDVERHHSIDIGIADRFFSEPETALLQEKDDGDNQAVFFDIWALKESYIKAIGKGLYCSLDGFACLPAANGDHVEFVRFDPTLPEMKLRLVRLCAGYSCAVCSKDGARVATTILTPGQLLRNPPTSSLP